MKHWSGHPATIAGLCGSLGTLAILPQTAQAATLYDTVESALLAIDPTYICGCISGFIGGSLAICCIYAQNNDRLVKKAAVTACHLASAERGSSTYEHHDSRDVMRPGKHFRNPGYERAGDIRVQSVDDTCAGMALISNDYGDVAQEYVDKLTLGNRMAIRARGVRRVLSDRLRANKMDGVPVIRRADGTICDVGTSWWHEAVGNDIRFGYEHELKSEQDTAASEQNTAANHYAGTTPKSTSFNDGLAASEANHYAETTPKSTLSVSSEIAARLGYIDMGLYPEKNDHLSSTFADDMWDASLQALEERSREMDSIEFEDSIGGSETLDEPEGLERATGFLPFRMPAGHPEIVDTDSYIDYLIRDEFARNLSGEVLRSSESFFRVIEGGSQVLPKLTKTDRVHGAHFRYDKHNEQKHEHDTFAEGESSELVSRQA